MLIRMGGRTRVVVVSWLLAGGATADGRPPIINAQCPARERAVVPEDGAREVPRNTQIWIEGGTAGAYVLRGRGGSHQLVAELVGPVPFVRLRPPRLDAGGTYTLRHDGELLVTFRTGATDDVAPPPKPLVLGLSIAPNATQLQIGAEHAPDAAVLEVSLADTRGTQELLAPTIVARAGFTGDPSCLLVLLPANARVCAQVRSVDLAGNRSEPNEICTYVVTEGPYGLPSVERSWEEHHAAAVRKRERSVGLALGTWSGMAVLAIVMMALRSWRVRRRFSADHALVAREPVVRLARSRRARWLGLGVVAVGLAGVALLVALDRDVVAWIVGGAAWLAIVAGTFAARANRVIEVLTGFGGEARTAGDGYVHAVRSGRSYAWIEADDKALVRAAGLAIPGARVVRD